MNENTKQQRIGRTTGLGLLFGAVFVAAAPLAAMAYTGGTGTATTHDTATKDMFTQAIEDEGQSRHECWESMLDDTESGSEELQALADAFTDCGGPWSDSSSSHESGSLDDCVTFLIEAEDIDENEMNADDKADFGDRLFADCITNIFAFGNWDIATWDVWDELG